MTNIPIRMDITSSSMRIMTGVGRTGMVLSNIHPTTPHSINTIHLLMTSTKMIFPTRWVLDGVQASMT